MIHNADTAIKKNDAVGMRNWLLVTIAMGAVFLGGQVYEYAHLEFWLDDEFVCQLLLRFDCFSRLARYVGSAADGGGGVAIAHPRSLF